MVLSLLIPHGAHNTLKVLIILNLWEKLYIWNMQEIISLMFFFQFIMHITPKKIPSAERIVIKF